MRFNCKAILSGFTRADGTQAVCLQAVINRKRAVVPLGFFVPMSQFNSGRVKSGYPNSDLYNLEIGKALGRAHEIASEYRLSDRLLNADLFRREFSNPINKGDFISFCRQELEVRKPKLSKGTYEQNTFAIDKLAAFKSHISFAELTVDLIQRYQNEELKKNCQNTVNKTLATIRLYIRAALRKGIKLNNPFDHTQIHKVKPHKVALSLDELVRIFKYYKSEECTDTHRHLLRYFLFSCANGLRISDIHILKWENISDNVITLMPKKTKGKVKVVQIPLSKFEIDLLPPYDPEALTVFDCYAFAVSNRYLKEIAAECKIKKRLTYHISRHTFATLFLEQGGRIEVLQDLMGHSDIDTTMVYAHISQTRKRTQKKETFDNIIPVGNLETDNKSGN